MLTYKLPLIVIAAPQKVIIMNRQSGVGDSYMWFLDTAYL